MGTYTPQKGKIPTQRNSFENETSKTDINHDKHHAYHTIM